MAGFTTIQSVGGVEDLDLRDAVARWQIPGPRILTSITQLSDTTLSPDSLRALRALAQGARRGRHQAVRVGRTRRGRQPDAVRRAARRDLRRSEGPGACARSSTRSARRACARRRSPAAPRSSTARSRRRPSSRSWPSTERSSIRRCVSCSRTTSTIATCTRGPASPTRRSTRWRRRSRRRRRCSGRRSPRPGLKIIFGTDAVALAHGRNADELICRVKAGQRPMDAITSATSATAAALGLGDETGRGGAGLRGRPHCGARRSRKRHRRDSRRCRS